MITVTVQITDECEELLTNLPRYHEYEITEDNGDGSVEFIVHDLDEITSGISQALNVNDGVISYDVD